MLCASVVTSMAVAEGDTWDRLHNVGEHGDGGPARHLFTDNDPATTVKGCGFRNADVAARTIKLAEQPGCLHKTYWIVRAMRERAARHPHQTPDTIAATAVFDAWLRERGERERRKIREKEEEELHAEERAQKAALVSSCANAHARRFCPSDAEFAAHARADKKLARSALRQAAAMPSARPPVKAGVTTNGVRFVLPATALVAMFGGPGLHSYGTHLCEDAQRLALPAFRCVCGFEGTHTVHVQREVREVLQLGQRFPFESFFLRWQRRGAEGGVDDIACLTACSRPRVCNKALGSRQRAESPARTDCNSPASVKRSKRNGQERDGTDGRAKHSQGDRDSGRPGRAQMPITNFFEKA